jgi:UDP-N-acetylmuramate--alanine ligase
LIVLFQPHRYTRTKDLINDFSVSFTEADSLIVLDIYPAGESPIEGVNSAYIVERIRETGYENVVYMKDREDARKYIIANSRKGDIVLTLGAGDVWKIGEEIVNKVKRRLKSA